ncbi:MAG: cell division protein SepF [Bifidobacteriaceae bacterium]|jgi:FtsZ-interacting cell division protein YlmF|nr:cell division protein SepF [Bifidobacteriaceae bacterium]
MAKFIDKFKEAVDFDGNEEDYTEYNDLGEENYASVNQKNPEPRTINAFGGQTKRIANFSPTSYHADATKIAKIFKQGTPVVFNAATLSEPDKNALIQFCAGLVYGLDGSIEKVASSEDVFLITPRNTEILKDQSNAQAPSFATEYFN